MRQKFVSDDDGHWYLINAEDEAEFDRWVEHEDMSLYNPDHPYSNGLELLLDDHSRDWPILFALVCERLQKIELDLAAVRAEIDRLKAAILEPEHSPTD